METAVKLDFDVEEGSTKNMWYKITVKRNGKKVDEFLKPSMQEAKDAFSNAGYRLVAWQERNKVVLQDL